MQYTNRLKKEFLESTVTKVEGYEERERVFSYYNLVSKKNYILNGKADDYLLIGAEMVFDFLSAKSKLALAKEKRAAFF